jgi:uncharacterized protein
LNNIMPKLNVLVLSDGRPGHFNKSRAVIRALRSQFEVTETWLNTDLRMSWARRLMALILNLTSKNYRCEWLLRMAYGVDCLKPNESFDMVISTGGNTMYANVLLARQLGCLNLFVGGLRTMGIKHFWRIMHHRAFLPAPPHLQWPVTLVDIDRGELADAAEALRSELNLGHETYWAFLIGGDGGGFSFTTEDMQDIARCIQRAHEQYGVKWLITSSRRTGKENESYLKSLLASEWVAATSWVGDEGPNHYRAFLGLAEQIVGTEDSQMMVAEAVAAGRPVHVLRPRHGKATTEDFLPHYETEGLISRQTLKEAAEQGFPKLEQNGGESDVGDLKKLGKLLADAFFQCNSQSL